MVWGRDALVGGYGLVWGGGAPVGKGMVWVWGGGGALVGLYCLGQGRPTWKLWSGPDVLCSRKLWSGGAGVP